DAPHDRRLMFDNDTLAFCSSRSVPVRQAAGREAIADAASHPAARMALQVLAVERSPHAVDERGNRALAWGLDADAEEFEPLAHVCAVFLVAPDTAHTLDDKHIKRLSLPIIEKAFNPSAAV